ncbi:MAG: hypothetical protein D4R81_00535 [Nitrospiraceae bacterium]|nr:MAG: hypothetical protein D4R81_00535 [Nitrospiraceae bacterium]
MPLATPEELGEELSELAFGIIEQNWLKEHIGKAVDVKNLDPMQANAAEWELTYLILFAITSGCGTFSATDRDRTTAALKAFHATFLKQIAEQVGTDIVDAHEKNLVPRYRLYGQTLEGEDTTHPYKTRYQRLGEAAAIQILGKPIEDPQAADIFRETIKVIFTEVREAVIKVMRHQQVAPAQGEA